jgi:hypothetical protein
VRIAVVLAAGLLAIAVAVVATLAHAPLTIARQNLPRTHHSLGLTERAGSACQSGESLPRDTSAIRLGMTTALGPRVTLEVLSGSHLITRGTRAPGWDGASVTVPVNPVSRTYTPVRVCFQLRQLNGPVEMLGASTGHARAAIAEGKALAGRMHVEYLRQGSASWWSMATATAWRFSIGRAASGPWNVFAVLTLVAALLTLSLWIAARELT